MAFLPAHELSVSNSSIEENADNIWQNFLVNLSPKTRRAGQPNIYPLSQVKKQQPVRNHFSVLLSGDIFDADESRFDAQQESDDTQKLDNRSDCSWYLFDEHDLLEPTMHDRILSYSETHGLNMSDDDHLEIHALSTSRSSVETFFRKTWGNFTNIFDEHGRQKWCFWRSELSNYLQLDNKTETSLMDKSPQSQSTTFLLSLFTGNYPKPLYRSIWSWRMRWNVFVAGIEEQVLIDLEGNCKEKMDDNGVSYLGSRLPVKSGDSKVLHLGEMHLYFHVERGHEWPTYQDLCFFFDPALVAFIKSKTESSQLFTAMKAVVIQLKSQLSQTEFISQLYFPIEKTRFSAVDQSVMRFELRQQDLQAAAAIVNEQVPFSFLHPPPVVEKPLSAEESTTDKSAFSDISRNSSSSLPNLSISNLPLAGAISSISSKSSCGSATWRRQSKCLDE